MSAHLHSPTLELLFRFFQRVAAKSHAPTGHVRLALKPSD